MNRRATAGFVYLIGMLAVAGILALGGSLAATPAGGLALQEVKLKAMPRANMSARQTNPVTMTVQPVVTTAGVTQPDRTPMAVDNLIGSNFAISPLENSETNPVIAWNATSNEYLVVWTDFRNGSVAIYGQRVGANGILLGSNFAICTARGDKWYPRVTWNATTNEYLVVWGDMRNGAEDIFGQRVRGNGTLLGGNFAVSMATGWQSSPAVAWNTTTNEYLVLWADSRSVSSSHIYGQRVASSGALLGTDFEITTGSVGQASPELVWNAAASEYLVVFTNWSVFASSIDVYGQRLDSSGAFLGGKFAIAASSEDEDGPAVVWNASLDEYLVVSMNENSSDFDVFSYDLYGQRVNRRGDLLGNRFSISTAADLQQFPALAWNTTGNEYLVVWQDYRNPSSRIYSQRVGTSGTLIGSDFTVDTVPPALAPDLAWSATANEYLVVWAGMISSASVIYGQRVVGGIGPTPTPMPVQQYLPLIMHRWALAPSAPVLDAITPPGANPRYTISWSAVSAASYVLERATSIYFADATQVYAGAATEYTAPSQGIARSHYRVKARNQWGDSPWSNVQSVEVRWEQEPNYPLVQANGPLISGLDYYGYPNDSNDYFFFQVASRGQVTIDLTNHNGQGLQLLLRTSTGALVTQVNVPPYHLVTTVDSGRYYVHIYSIGNFNTTTPYTLRAVFP